MNSPFSIDDQIKEVEREIAMRVRVYPGMIRSGKLSLQQADWQTDCMREVARSLRSIKSVMQGELKFNGDTNHADEPA